MESDQLRKFKGQRVSVRSAVQNPGRLNFFMKMCRDYFDAAKYHASVEGPKDNLKLRDRLEKNRPDFRDLPYSTRLDLVSQAKTGFNQPKDVVIRLSSGGLRLSNEGQLYSPKWGFSFNTEISEIPTALVIKSFEEGTLTGSIYLNKTKILKQPVNSVL